MLNTNEPVPLGANPFDPISIAAEDDNLSAEERTIRWAMNNGGSNNL